MQKRYLMYIDILGFRKINENNPQRIDKLYLIIDQLHAHEHPNFTTIVFSDTILIYSKDLPSENSEHDNQYLVMYLIEFAQDLQHRLVGSGIFFRAQLRYDNFEHHTLKNVQCFYGNNLIKSYEEESKIPAIGIFIDAHCQKYNNIFPSVKFSSDLFFVFVNQSFERLARNTDLKLPTNKIFLENADEYWDILWDLSYLQVIYEKSLKEMDPIIRTKYVNTWRLFENRYSKMLLDIRDNNFDPHIICPKYDWIKMVQRFNDEIKETI